VVGPAEAVGDLSYRQSVEVAQGQCGAVVWAECVEHGAGADGVDGLVPRVLGFGAVEQPQSAFLAFQAAPVVGEFVPGDADEPADRGGGHVGSACRGDGGEERLRGQVLGQCRVPAARQQVAVDVR
jgi:hypothetical protein